MNRLIYGAALSIAFVSFSVSAQAQTVTEPEPFIEIVHAAQFPEIIKPSNATNVRQSFSLWIPKTSSQVSELIINIPNGLRVAKDITVSDNLQKNLQSKINVNGNKIVINFPQPVSSGTTLNISLNHVDVEGVSNSWDYPVSAKFVGINREIPVGVAEFRVY